MIVSLTDNQLDVELAENLSKVLDFGDVYPLIIITSESPHAKVVASKIKELQQDSNPLIFCIGIAEHQSTDVLYGFEGVPRITIYNLEKVDAELFKRIINLQVSEPRGYVSLDHLELFSRK